MHKSDKAKKRRKQAEEAILRNMRQILSRVPFSKTQNEKTQETVDRSHVFSVIHRFTEIKRSTKIH